MTEPSRLQMLAQFLEQNPGDAFARYGLAMEYSKAGETEQALAEFKRLLELHPDYTNGYLWPPRPWNATAAPLKQRRCWKAAWKPPSVPEISMRFQRCQGCWMSWVDSSEIPSRARDRYRWIQGLARVEANIRECSEFKARYVNSRYFAATSDRFSHFSIPIQAMMRR